VSLAATGSTWVNSFVEANGMTLVTNHVLCDTLAQLDAQIEMGFKEGYSVGVNQLEELVARLQAQVK